MQNLLYKIINFSLFNRYDIVYLNITEFVIGV